MDLLAMLILVVVIGVPSLIVYLIWRVRPNEPAPSAVDAGGSNSLPAWRSPLVWFTSLLSAGIGWIRRKLQRLEMRLNLVIINDAVVTKRDQAKTVEQLLGEVSQLGLKVETVAALQGRLTAINKSADGLAATTTAFAELLQALVKKEADFAKIHLLAIQCYGLQLPPEAMADIDARLRCVGNELEVERVKFAQAVEHTASCAHSPASLTDKPSKGTSIPVHP